MVPTSIYLSVDEQVHILANGAIVQSITKLEVKRLRDGRFSHEVQSLEKRKLQLDTVSGMTKTRYIPFFTMILCSSIASSVREKP